MAPVCFLPALIVALCLTLAAPVAAQTFTVLHSFSAMESGTNSDGATSLAGLALSGNTLYGTTAYGGTWGNGTIFKLNTDGSGFTTIYNFSATDPDTGLNRDGLNPEVTLIVSGSTLYGTTAYGGVGGEGTVFRVDTDGNGFVTMYSFGIGGPIPNGAQPNALIMSGGLLFGSALSGGFQGFGTTFSLSPDGRSFSAFADSNDTEDGPVAGVVLDGVIYCNMLAGKTMGGAGPGNGAVFAIATNGDFGEVLHTFEGSDGDAPYGSLAAAPAAPGLYALYGTAGSTIFFLRTDGSGFARLHTFAAGEGNSQSGLILSSGALYETLYGTAYGGGTWGNGTIFRVTTGGQGFTNLYSFTGGIDGMIPSFNGSPNSFAGLILTNNVLYCTTPQGGSAGNGTVYSFSLVAVNLPFSLEATLTTPSALLLQLSGAPKQTYTLQSASSLVPPVNWQPVFTNTADANGNWSFTNASLPAQGTLFYRASGP